MQKAEPNPTIRNIGLVVGVVFFVALLFVPIGQDPRTHRMAAIAALMAVWWITEAIPLAATSLLPLVLMPMLKIMEPKQVAKSYMDDYIFLFVGGFIIALAMERWQLHRRLALQTIRLVGDRPRQIVLGFMLAAGGLSLWISNTATAMMMMPIALSVVLLAEERLDAANDPAAAVLTRRFGLVLMLSIAYAASIGGVGTLIGTPPNVVFANRFHASFPNAPEIGFARWFILLLPFSIVFLLIAWALLVYVLHPLRGGRLFGGREILTRELSALGPVTRAELGVLVVFVAAALLWIFRVDIEIGERVRIPGWANMLGLIETTPRGKVTWVGDGTVAMLAALTLFFLPSGRKTGERLVDWKTVEDLPWGVLFLFGGGFALADGFGASGLSNWIGEQSKGFGNLSVPGQIATISTTITFLTELTSNTATTNMVLPVLAGVSKEIGTNPLVLMLPATISASCAFMLPVATPPNAVVFGTGYIPIRTMVKTGFVLNIVGIVLVLFLIYFLAIPLWDIHPGTLPADWLGPPP